MPLEPNSLLHDRYRILSELGHGGMGAVYRGHDENLGMEVAIKENLSVSPESGRQFKREASLLAQLRHPNLPRVTDHFVIADQGQYLVMDFISGEDAKNLLEAHDGPLAERDVVRWGREILNALSYLHGRPQPIIHRDIKPGNIKITPEGRAVLVDFGLAKVHDTTQSTTVGAKAFTPGFAPPEQYGLGRTDPRTDIYSLGATLYTLLTGQMPAESLERAMNQQKLIPIRELNPKVTDRTAEALERALAVKPEDRFDSAAEFADALPPVEEFTVSHKVEATRLAARPETPGPTLPVTPERRLPIGLFLGIGAGVLVLGGLIAGGIWAAGAFAGGSTPTAVAQATRTPPPSATAEVIVVVVTETSAPVDTAAPPTDTPTPTATPTVTLTPTPAATQRGGGGGQIAFVSERNGRPQIFIMNVDGSNQLALTNQADGACQPAWSPDGQFLLFVSPCDRKTERYPRAIIFKMNADGTNIQPLISLIGGVYDPDWSVNGIAFAYLENNTPQIFWTGPEGGNPSRLSQLRSDDRQPSWAGNGERIVFLNTTRAGRPTLYWMNKDGTFAAGRTLPDQVTRDLDASSPDWSPDGQSVLFVSNFQISIVGWDQRGFGVTPLTVVGPNDSPDWSPDSQWVAFESWRDAANHDIYIMNRGGGQQTRLTTDSAWDYQPAWRP